MTRRLWISVAMLTAGAWSLATAALAGSSSLKKGGVFRVGTTGASVQIDPQLGYVTTAWWLEYATAAKLYNYPDRGGVLLRPEVASGFKVSNGGRTYTFFIRKYFKFSDGNPVTARSFAYAIDRAANKALASPAAQFITDPNGTDIVGARAVNNGEATHVSGVTAKGNRLIIRLRKPDAAFLTKISMPFFQATSRKLPLTREAVGSYPSAGPYWFTRNDVNVLTSIRRNAYYLGRRPHKLGGLDLQWNLNEQTGFEQVKANQLDEGPLPAAEVQGVADQYGVNKSRFWAMPTNCLGYLPFNTHRALFGHSLALRKALNWAVDRTAFAAQAGPYSGSPWTHLLPPGFPGSVMKKRLQPYSVHPNLAKAKRLIGDYVVNRKITVGYRSSGTIFPAQAQLVRRDLIRLGFKPENITMKPYSGADIYDAMGVRGNPLDLGISLGMCSDYPEPFEPLRWFVGGPYGVDSPKYRRKLEAAERLSPNARLRALGKLDLEITRNLAPAVAMRSYNNRYFFSSRVDPRSLAWSPIYQDWSIPALALK
jgi:ABC-type oligopeptide transport system substrate-binding subunit